MRFFLSGFIILLLQGCMTMSYESSSNLYVSANRLKTYDTAVSVEGRRDFYLWGLYPNEHVVNIGTEFNEAGYKNVSGVSIIEETNFLDSFLAIISLGLMIPQSYRLEGYTK